MTTLLLLWLAAAHADIAPPAAPEPPDTDLAAPTGPAPQTPWLPSLLLGLGGVAVVSGAAAAIVRRRQTA